MPVGKWDDFESCVKAASAKGIDDPKAYCGAIENKMKEERPALNFLTKYLAKRRGGWRS